MQADYLEEAPEKEDQSMEDLGTVGNDFERFLKKEQAYEIRFKDNPSQEIF